MIDEVLNAQISRRDFLKGTAAATAALAGLGMGGRGRCRRRQVGRGALLAQLRRQVSGPRLCQGRCHCPPGH